MRQYGTSSLHFFKNKIKLPDDVIVIAFFLFSRNITNSGKFASKFNELRYIVDVAAADVAAVVAVDAVVVVVVVVDVSLVAFDSQRVAASAIHCSIDRRTCLSIND